MCPKMDGVRAVGMFEKEVVLYTRNGNDIVFAENVKKDLLKVFQKFPDVILDGEVYIHGEEFNNISGAVRATKTPSIYDNKLEYWIFDIIDENDLAILNNI